MRSEFFRCKRYKKVIKRDIRISDIRYKKDIRRDIRISDIRK